MDAPVEAVRGLRIADPQQETTIYLPFKEGMNASGSAEGAILRLFPMAAAYMYIKGCIHQIHSVLIVMRSF